MSRTNNYQQKAELAHGEEKLWAMVIEQAIRDANRKCRGNYWNGSTQAAAREFFQHRQCDVILRALDADPDWFIGKLKARHPEIFNNAMEGQG